MMRPGFWQYMEILCTSGYPIKDNFAKILLGILCILDKLCKNK